MSQNIYGNEKTCGPTILLKSYMQHKCLLQVNSYAGWSIFLFHVSENECSEQVLENFRNFSWQKFSSGNDFRRH